MVLVSTFILKPWIELLSAKAVFYLEMLYQLHLNLCGKPKQSE